jgi:Pyruvate/2-oxoacid:ferredoxin oxidoreductase gamma subunit
MSEVLRVLPMARRGALAFINTFRRLPVAAGVAGIHYPMREEIEVALDEAGVNGIFVPETLPSPSGEAEDGQQSNSRVNIIMLGVFCSYTQLLPRAALEKAITSRLPRFAEQNLRTFSAGWSFAEALRAQNMA